MMGNLANEAKYILKRRLYEKLKPENLYSHAYMYFAISVSLFQTYQKG